MWCQISFSIARAPVFPFDIDIANEKWSRLLKRADRRFFYMVINTTKITAPIIRIIKKSIGSEPQTIPLIFKPQFPTFFVYYFFSLFLECLRWTFLESLLLRPICHLIHFLCFGFSLRNKNIYCFCPLASISKF